MGLSPQIDPVVCREVALLYLQRPQKEIRVHYVMIETTASTTYETIIGLEVHVQLRTASKMFCRDSAAYSDAAPNSHVCPVCLGMPGVLPVINRAAVEGTVLTALALNCGIPPFAKFDRKNYHYPDLMKGYQISEYDQPLSAHGWLEIEGSDGSPKRVGITRVHLEEDTARLLHRADPVTGEAYSLLDVNRSGIPLMEIVSEPDMRSPEEARRYLVKLQQILRYIGVSDADMEKGNFRCDANISLRPAGSTKFGAKVEVKNMNSFRSVFRALEYEVARQSQALDAGERIVQETRGWVENEGRTASQRTKEQAHDYRYFPEPDLPPLTATPEWVASVRARLHELPDVKRARFMEQYGLPRYEANLLVETVARADFFETAVAAFPASDEQRSRARARAVANWMLGDLAHLLTDQNVELQDANLRPEHLVDLVVLQEDGTISSRIAKSVFEEMFRTGRPAREIVEASGLTQISGSDELAGAVTRVIEANPKAVADVRNGKQEALKFLMGQVMRETRGRANPETVQQLLRETLEVTVP
jgi:aspartyl-tRNA(Asn)/glutamyl-tRNA(Gln) amidotransferase subunit B